MARHQSYLAAGFLAFVVLGGAQPASAGDDCARITDPFSRSRCYAGARMGGAIAQFNSLPPRQQDLSRAVSQVLENAGYGMRIVPVNPTTVAAIADAVGAATGERPWVQKVIESHNDFVGRINSFDRQLDAVDRNLCSAGLRAFCK